MLPLPMMLTCKAKRHKLPAVKGWSRRPARRPYASVLTDRRKSASERSGTTGRVRRRKSCRWLTYPTRSQDHMRSGCGQARGRDRPHERSQGGANVDGHRPAAAPGESRRGHDRVERGSRERVLLRFATYAGSSPSGSVRERLHGAGSVGIAAVEDGEIVLVDVPQLIARVEKALRSDGEAGHGHAVDPAE